MVKDATGSDSIGLLCLALAPVLTAAAVLLVGHKPGVKRAAPQS